MSILIGSASLILKTSHSFDPSMYPRKNLLNKCIKSNNIPNEWYLEIGISRKEISHWKI